MPCSSACLVEESQLPDPRTGNSADSPRSPGGGQLWRPGAIKRTTYPSGLLGFRLAIALPSPHNQVSKKHHPAEDSQPEKSELSAKGQPDYPSDCRSATLDCCPDKCSHRVSSLGGKPLDPRPFQGAPDRRLGRAARQIWTYEKSPQVPWPPTDRPFPPPFPAERGPRQPPQKSLHPSFGGL